MILPQHQAESCQTHLSLPHNLLLRGPAHSGSFDLSTGTKSCKVETDMDSPKNSGNAGADKLHLQINIKLFHGKKKGLKRWDEDYSVKFEQGSKVVTEP